MVSPFGLSPTLPVGGRLLVPLSSPGPPVTHVSGLLWCWPGWAVSVSGVLNRWTLGFLWMRLTEWLGVIL